MRTVVTGLCATYPFGGVFWDYAQYLIGFSRLGHDVLYVEDTGRPCYDPRREEFVTDGAANAATLQRHLARTGPGLAHRWFYRDAAGQTFGLSWEKVAGFCRSADLFLQVSASTVMRDEYFAPHRRVFVDSDPMYTPATLPMARPTTPRLARHLEWTRAHDAFFTFGENVGAPDCRISCDELPWQPTRQPIVLDCFESARVPLARRRKVLTTVGSWEPGKWGPTIDGVRCGGKAREFERFLELGRRSPMPIELALSGSVPKRRLVGHGFDLVDAWPVSRDPWAYLSYLAHSAGEWSVAKNAYVVGRTGWFSGRTACYLALGVPAVVQDTGFRRFFPVGEGLLAFATVDEAVEAIEHVQRDPSRHSAAAMDLAREHFDSDRVLGDLVGRAFAAQRNVRRPRQESGT